MAGAFQPEAAALERAERHLPGRRHSHPEPPADAGEIYSELAAAEGCPDGHWCYTFTGTLAVHEV